MVVSTWCSAREHQRGALTDSWRFPPVCYRELVHAGQLQDCQEQGRGGYRVGLHKFREAGSDHVTLAVDVLLEIAG